MDVFSLGDRVLLKWKQGKVSKRKLTQPLREDGETIVDNHQIKHKDIIGQASNFRLLNVSRDGLRKISLFAGHPTLDEFTSLAPRRVAPIYATYASTIVSLLDIHVEGFSADEEAASDGWTHQILEAGTGHGSLTLQLARAIAAANPPVPPEIKPKPSPKQVYKAGEKVDSFEETSESTLADWHKRRRAVLHTVDIDPENREHADKLIRSYRNAMYWPHIDFHAGSVEDWVSTKLAATGQQPFLDIVVLDMPGVEERISSTVNAIKAGGQLLVFVPQITQIAACVQKIASERLGLKLDKIVELGEAISTGRLWDVRVATLKHPKLVASSGADGPTLGLESQESADETEVVPRSAGVGIVPPMVCRPMVGELTRGGGFIGLWKRIAREEDMAT